MDTGKIKKTDPERKFRRVLSASTLEGDKVKNPAGETLGKLDEVMIDLESGRIEYCVLSFGGILGMGTKLFAVPWQALRVDQDDKSLIMDIDKSRLENAPGFDKDNWPDTADRTFASSVYSYYGVEPYWQESEGTREERRFRGGGGL